MAPTVYLSFDIEADGPSPACNSMLSLGICGLDAEGTEIMKYQENIYPLIGHTMDANTKLFWDAQPEAWEFVNTNQVDYHDAMQKLSDELDRLKEKGYTLKWIAQPAAYDWQWLNYYWNLCFNGHKPLAYKAECISTMYSTYCLINRLSNEDNNKLWNELYGKNPCPHNSYYDAKHQGFLYVGLLRRMTA